jgi:hypothetical protein
MIESSVGDTVEDRPACFRLTPVGPGDQHRAPGVGVQLVRSLQYLVAGLTGPPGPDNDQGDVHLRDGKLFESCA